MTSNDWLPAILIGATLLLSVVYAGAALDWYQLVIASHGQAGPGVLVVRVMAVLLSVHFLGTVYFAASIGRPALDPITYNVLIAGQLLIRVLIAGLLWYLARALLGKG